MSTNGVIYPITVDLKGEQALPRLDQATLETLHGFQAMTAEINRVSAALRGLPVEDLNRNMNSAGDSGRKLTGDLHGVSGGAKEAGAGVDFLTEHVGEFAAAAAAAFSIEKLVEYGKEILNVTAEMQGFENRIKFTSTGAADAGENMDFLKHVVKDMKLPIKEVYEGFSEMEAGLVGTGIEGKKLRDLFNGLSTAAASVSLPTYQLQRTMYDLKEIGEIGLNGRIIRSLSTALPGIGAIVKKTFGKSMNELKDEITGPEFLEKIGPALTDTFKNGLSAYTSSLRASMVQTANDLYLKELEVGEKLEGVYKGIMSTMRGAIFAGGGAVIDAIDFLKEHFKDIQSDVSEMSKAITQSFESVDTSKAWKAAGEVFNSFVHDIWGGIKPLLESVYQFKDQAIEVFSFIGTAVGGAITVLGEYWGGLYKVAAGIIDVLHTVYVFLDKLGVIGMVVDDFRFLGTVLEGIGIGLNSIYEQTLKPIFEAIGWVYAQIKELLGIKSMALKVKYEGPYAPKDMGFGSYGKDEAMFDAAGKEIGTGESKADPIAEGMKGVAGAAGNQVRNVTVNMDSLVKGVTIVYDQLKHNPKRVLADFEDALMTITRDAEIALG